MTAVKIEWPDVTTRTVNATVGLPRASHVSVTAPTVSGYEFVCWLNVATVGWVGALYMETATNATTDAWVVFSNATSGTGTIKCLALYKRSM